MEQKNVAFQELRVQYVTSSKRKLEQIEELLSRLEKDPDNREALADLHRQFHGFFGSGSTYGFPAITTAGLQGEKLCDSLLSQPDPASKEQLESLKKLHEDLKQAFSSVPTGAWAPPQEAEVVPPKVHTIYVVDNDRDVADLLVRLIEREGMIARRFSTKEKAMGAIEQQIPDGMIIDIHLPDGTGYELVEHLRGLPGGDNPAVLMVSVVAGFLDKVEAIRCGADGYFEKVVDWESLLRRLQHLLDRGNIDPSRILSMEDDPEQSAFVKAVLESAGYTVRISEDPRRFEAELVAFHPDLVLMDVVLPEISGYDLVRYIRQDEKYAILPVLFLTTQSQLQSKIEMVKAGADDYLIKPVSPGLLLSTVAARLERARFLQSLLDKDGLTRLLTHT
ncbi:MAG TPA: response regulator, partial [Acidobacteriota bacterium]|nr:response regulator [Acidobacteriota bacterium]